MFANNSDIHTIVIATTNPTKIKAVQDAFHQMFPDLTFQFLSCAAPSGVPDQPMTSAETVQGAINRARTAKERMPEGEYWVGIEGGLELEGSEFASFSWAAIISSDDRIGKGKSATFYLPKELSTLVLEGTELGVASDIIFSQTNCKHSNGAVGLLTRDHVTRPALITPSVLLACIPFFNKDLTFA